MVETSISLSGMVFESFDSRWRLTTIVSSNFTGKKPRVFWKWEGHIIENLYLVALSWFAASAMKLACEPVSKKARNVIASPNEFRELLQEMKKEEQCLFKGQH